MNQKGFIKDIVIIVLGILILGGGYFYFSKNPAYAPSENSNVNVNQKVADKTADWKTYRNEKYGIKFNYPSGWYFYQGAGGTGLIQIISSNQLGALDSPQIQEKVEISLGTSLSPKEAEDNLTTNHGMITKINSSEYLTIDGRKAVKLNYEFINGKGFQLVIDNKGINHTFTAYISKSNNDNKLIIDEIIKSIKFE